MPDWLCVDVGFTNTRMAICRDGAFDPVQHLRSIDGWADKRLSAGERRDRWIDWLRQQIAAAISSHPAVSGIGICIPGPVDRRGVIAAGNSLWGDADGTLSPRDLEQSWGRPVHVVNDLVATAICYGADPALADAETVLVVNVGSGIGSKLYDRRNGAVVLGRDGLNGEIGFTMVDEGPDAALSLDGTLRGTLGLYASGSGFARLLRSVAVASPDAFAGSTLRNRIARTGAGVETIDRVDLNAAAFEAIAAGDAFTMAILRRSIGYLAKALHGVILFTAPDRLVIAGGFATAIGETYRALLCEALEPQLRPLYPAQRIDTLIGLGRTDGMDNLIGLARLLDRPDGAAS